MKSLLRLMILRLKPKYSMYFENEIPFHLGMHIYIYIYVIGI